MTNINTNTNDAARRPQRCSHWLVKGYQFIRLSQITNISPEQIMLQPFFSCFFHWWFTFQHLSPIVGRFVNFESHQFCKTFLDALHKPSNRKKLLTHLGLSVRRVRRAGDPRYGMDRDGFWWGAWNATGNKTSTKTMITMGVLGILQGDNIIWY